MKNAACASYCGSSSPLPISRSTAAQRPSKFTNPFWHSMTTVAPSRYDLRLEPDLDAATFRGEEVISVTVEEPVTASAPPETPAPVVVQTKAKARPVQ